MIDVIKDTSVRNKYFLRRRTGASRLRVNIIVKSYSSSLRGYLVTSTIREHRRAPEFTVICLSLCIYLIVP